MITALPSNPFVLNSNAWLPAQTADNVVTTAGDATLERVVLRTGFFAFANLLVEDFQDQFPPRN